MPWDVNLICSVTTLINFSQHLYVKDQVHGCEKHKRTALTCLCSSPFFPEKMWPCRYAFPAGGLKPSPLHTSHPLPGPRWAGGALLPGYWQGSRWRRRSEDINKDETWFVFFFPPNIQVSERSVVELTWAAHCTLKVFTGDPGSHVNSRV